MQKRKKWAPLVDVRKKNQVAIVFTRGQVAWLRQLILDHGPEPGTRTKSADYASDIFGATTAAALYFQEKDKRARRRQKVRTDIATLEKMLGTGEQMAGS